MKNLKVLLLVILVVSFTATAFAVPMVNIANDGTEDLTNGSTYAYYQNSGQYLFFQEGNNEGANFENLKAYMLSNYGVELTPTTVSWTNYDDNSGTWTTDPIENMISYYVIKAGLGFAMYEVNPEASTGSWSTYDLSRYGDAGYGGRGGVAISHYNGYNVSTSVPEPGMLTLFGSGLLGLGFFGRKKIRK